MPQSGHAGVKGLREYHDPGEAVARISRIYRDGVARIRERFRAFADGDRASPAQDAFYPYVGVSIDAGAVSTDSRLAYGNLPEAGAFGTTVTQPGLMESYYREQLALVMRNHDCPVLVGISDRPIPLTFAIAEAEQGMSGDDVADLQRLFTLPNLAEIDDGIVNGKTAPMPGRAKPLALFSAERVDYSLSRLKHYTGTRPEHFQRFVLFTNYQRYVDEFIEYGLEEVRDGTRYRAFVEPGDAVTANPRFDAPEDPGGSAPRHLPQMPAYHLVGDRHMGVTLVNIGVGPSNAKTITDHIAVLRPHCWLMVGHCGGLRRTQRLGDYVLAHAYVREDHVLDQDLPTWVPVPPIAEVQVALMRGVTELTGLAGAEMKARVRTGTVFTTDDRDWELRHADLALRFNQSRAIAVDMESATIAANGYRFRVPYGTLLCVSDKPLHGEIKLPGMANAFYRERVSQHLKISLRALEVMREEAGTSLHSRKLRSFDEPAFR